VDLLDRLKLDVPVAQAGMAGAGGLGTIGMCAPSTLTAGIDRVRQEAPDRASTHRT